MKLLLGIVKVTGALLLLAMGACGVYRFLVPDQKAPRPFSHVKHGREQELECTSCHTKAEKGVEAGMPAGLKRCMLCHEGQDEQKPSERRLAAIVGDPPQWTRVTALPDEVRFSHQTHHEAKVACAECHRGIETCESITGEVRVSKDACMTCHAERGKKNECAVCHTEIRRDVAPATHHRNWTRRHGDEARAGEVPPYENRCALCHTQATCVSCHQDEAPRNHTNFWRVQGHAVAVAVDRSTCATCHRSDFCDRCHRDTAPRTHTAAWGLSQNRHCLGCHAEAGPNRPCITCHVRAVHETAVSRPADAQHAGATENQCRSCHLIIGLPHLDNGDRCGSCH
ncbi:MAG: cytochrome c3 family protein [Planctomycetes bacterium]|nr:cytochrome c3 family protein [Planctomycetota bacterium]